MLELRSDALRVTLSPHGARLASVIFDGVEVVMGREGDWTAGAVCGRHAGRITNSRFALDGHEYKLVPNMGEHQLHGGPDNFALRDWAAKGSTFSLVSPDGDQGYPGELSVTAAYALEGSTLSLDLEARTSKPTVLNLTNHAYWNLAGGGSAFDHEMQIDGETFLPLNDLLLPSGEIRKVEGTRWDFRKMRKVGEAYDNCWMLNGARGTLRKGLTLRDPKSKRTMEVWTTEPAMQMYTANHWTSPLTQYAAIAIEPQNAPDAPAHANFPSAVLRPGEIYRNRIEWRFG